MRSIARIYYIEEDNKELNKMAGDIILTGLAPQFFNDPESCPHMPRYQGLPYWYMEHEDIPKWDFVEQLHTKDYKNLNSDIKWEDRLMPICLIAGKHILKTQKKIKEELDKKNPDVSKVLKMKFEIDNVMNVPHVEWYNQALINLDERCKNGEDDKPEVREKLIKRTTHPYWIKG